MYVCVFVFVYICECVCECVYACVCVCLCVCVTLVRVCVRVYVCVWVRAYLCESISTPLLGYVLRHMTKEPNTSRKKKKISAYSSKCRSWQSTCLAVAALPATLTEPTTTPILGVCAVEGASSSGL